ncbi:MAG: hypothetical protein JEY79_13975 [Pseudodesulfovibrio sp.]|nr:hypothetical protein [Pseudodesulfovibrio sp.]
MSTISGRFARVVIGSNIVAEMGNMNINRSTDEVDTTSFGDGWGKSDVGMKKWSGAVSGSLDAEDANGQQVLEDAWDSGELVQDIRFYMKYSTTVGDKVVYYAPDTESDADAGVRILTQEVATDKSGVASVSFNFSGSGPCKKIVETLT